MAVQHPGEGGTYDKPTSKWPYGTGNPVFVKKSWGRGTVGS